MERRSLPLEKVFSWASLTSFVAYRTRLLLGLTIASAFVPWIVLIVATLTMPVHSESWLARIVFFAIGAAVLTISDKPSCRRSFAKPRSYHCCWF
ncbi:MAG: hypothetical protein JWP25_1188 [Bradyrhizobium sp.]|nr:hypothetical protein [Bradyrhizobium sp.]